jgi:hypothetical protein
MKRRCTPQVGRPPAGLNGEPTSKYPQLAARVPRATLDRVRALAARERRSIWRVLADAIEMYDGSTRGSGLSISDEVPAPPTSLEAPLR